VDFETGVVFSQQKE